ncbi:MAG: cyanophycin synthetase, partial [Planctomycetota bacterium]
RIQRIQRTDQPTVIVDGAHNSDSVAALMQAVLRRCAHKNGRTLVFATSRDKDAPQMLRQLLPHYSNVVLTRFLDNPRGAQPRNLLRDVQKISTDLNLNNELSVTVTDSPAEAILAADEKTDNDGWIVVCGSFFLAGEMLDVLQQRRQ